jgi:hypothetical protein
MLADIIFQKKIAIRLFLATHELFIGIKHLLQFPIVSLMKPNLWAFQDS